jgi:hypothetical protein
MVLTSRQAAARARAISLGEQGRTQDATSALRRARRDAARIARLLSGGPYAYLPGTTFWRDSWTIARRPGLIDQELALTGATGEWQPVAIPDADFRQHSWSVAEIGRSEWVEDPVRGGCARLDNSHAEGKWSAIASPPVVLQPGAPFRVTFDTRLHGQAGLLWAQWLTAEGVEVGARMTIAAPNDGQWHPVTLQGITPSASGGDGLRLRFVLVWPATEALLANLKLQQRPVVTPTAGR